MASNAMGAPAVIRQEERPHGTAVLLTPRQVAEFLQVKLPRIYELVSDGKIRAVRVGRQLRFRRQDLEVFLTRHTT
jgi:excisionase family DNA binding protein